jgi:hypothetical protein
MNTKRLVFSNISMSVILTAAVVMVYAFTFGTAFAATVPTIETQIKNGSNATVTTASIGTGVRAQSTVASTTGPVALGTVNFSLYPNTTCSGTPTTQSGVLLASGVADSSTTTVGSNGLSYKVFYSGQGDVYASTTSNCVGLQATSGTVGMNTTLSSSTVLVGTSVYQTALLTGVTANATGTVAYGVYTNNACSADKVDAGTKNVVDGVVSQSNSIQFNTVGTLYFQAKYSGDQFNSAVNGTCQTLSVINPGTPTPTPTPTPGSGSISGVAYNDANTNFKRDGGEAGISGFTMKLYGGNYWWWGKKKNMPVAQTVTTDANGVYTFSNLADGVYKVEEIKLGDWVQMSSDYHWVLVVNGKALTGLDFANASKDAYNNWKSGKKVERENNKEKKEEKREEQKNKKISKLQERIEKIKNR